MIGEHIHGRDGNRKVWLFWAVVVVPFVVCNFAMRHDDLLLLALAPAGVAIVTGIMRRPALEAVFEEDGIHVLVPEEQFVPYRDIQALCRGDNGYHHFPIVVTHAAGILRIPADVDVSSDEIYHFLNRQLPEVESICPPPALSNYNQSHQREFGMERVFGYRILPDAERPRSWRGVIICGALLITSFVWMIVGFENKTNYESWGGAGAVLFLGALLGALICLIVSGSSAARGPTTDGGLIISPLGIALQQDQLCGQMRWDEIKQIERRHAPEEIRISFEGGRVRIKDYLNQPLRDVYQRLLDYWEGPTE
jgi:hypothetical protein